MRLNPSLYGLYRHELMTRNPTHVAPFLCFVFQGDVWICMELMDTSLDKFYKKVIEKGKTIQENILGKIAVAVRSVRDRTYIT